MLKGNDQSPLIKMNKWMEREKSLGSPYPDRVMLATCSSEGTPHSRIVAIREVSSEGILFFTQRNTRKVIELMCNPTASMTLWLALQQRQVILEGVVRPLTDNENKKFWVALPRERQLRFSAYAPTSGKVIDSVSTLEHRLNSLTKSFLGNEIPMSAEYCGFHLIAKTVYFYTLGEDTFSESLKYKKYQDSWSRQLMSP